MAGHIFSNYAKVETLQWILGAIGGWLGLVVDTLAYMMKNCKCIGKKGRRAREVVERGEEGRPLRNNI